MNFFHRTPILLPHLKWNRCFPFSFYPYKTVFLADFLFVEGICEKEGEEEERGLYSFTVCIRDLDKLNFVMLVWFYARANFRQWPNRQKIVAHVKSYQIEPKIIIWLLLPTFNLNSLLHSVLRLHLIVRWFPREEKTLCHRSILILGQK